MDADHILEKFNELKGTHNIQFDLKKEQLEIATAILNGRNVVGLLPTGFDKTLCATIPSLVKSKERTVTLVISPLSSLMDDQMSALARWNFTCAKIQPLSEMTDSTIEGITNGVYQFVFSSPESALKTHWRNVFLSTVWQKRLTLITIDEAHCISEWGDDFRPEYTQLSELRSFFRVPVLALTATSTSKVLDDIMERLQLIQTNTEIVTKSCNRPNIFMQVMKRDSSDLSISLEWLIGHIRQNGKSSKKIILYARSISAVAEIFLTMKSSLGKDAYADGIQDSQHILVEMFHKSTHQTSKDRILSDFKSESGTIRCVIATVALGMGLDIRDIDMVIHIGCPKSIVSYWQEAGMCARDGRQGISLILFDIMSLSLSSTATDIATIIRNSSEMCVRQQVIDALTVGDKSKLDTSPCGGCSHERCQCSACRCCSVCCVKCPCNVRNGFDIPRCV